jgi:uncharacterized protein (TIGR04255 family)
MQESVEKGPLPDYENPPVVETILGVQFERLPGFRNAHLGAFWKTLNTEEWPEVSDAPPLQPESEQFTESARWAPIGARLMVTQDLSSRTQIKNRAGDGMIQVQNGRFHFNWLGQAGGQYPRYRSVRQGFLEALQQFITFVIKEKVGDFRPNQWEVTYLNHILKGTVWNAPNDWGFFQPLLGAVPTVDGLVKGESFTGGWHFVIPERRGRLHIEWQHGKKSEPGEQEVIVLTFTARGSIEKSENVMRAILDGVDLGRETIVRSFATFMSQQANSYWGIKNARD